jgi:hypothetical protein
VWIDGDGQARKVTTEIDATMGTVTSSIEYYDFGAAVSVQAPPASDTLDFSDLLGGLGTIPDVATAAT